MRASAGGAIAARQIVVLLGQLGVGEVLVGELRGVAACSARAGQAGERPLGGAADSVHQEEALLGRRVTGGEHQVRALRGVDVRHAEAGVAIDGGAWIAGRMVRRTGAAGHRAEIRVLVEAVQVRRLQRERVGHDPDVEGLLVDEGVGRLAGGLVLGEVRGVHRLALPLGEDRAEGAECGCGARRRCHQCTSENCRQAPRQSPAHSREMLQTRHRSAPGRSPYGLGVSACQAGWTPRTSRFWRLPFTRIVQM